METLSTLGVDDEDDVFAARQLARVCAEELGLDRLDAIRFATAVYELGRETVRRGGGRLSIRLSPLELLLDLTVASTSGWSAALEPVRRLVDDLVTTDGDVTLVKRLPT